MKIIGQAAGGEMICLVNKTEVEKYLGLYYGKMPKDMMDVGNTIDLGKGYDYHWQITEAMKKTQEFIAHNRSVIEAIMNGLTIVGRTDAATPTEKDA